MVVVPVPFSPRLQDKLSLPSDTAPGQGLGLGLGHSTPEFLSQPRGEAAMPCFAILGGDGSKSLVLGPNKDKEHSGSLTDRHQLIRSDQAFFKVATVLGSSQVFPATGQKLKPCQQYAFQLTIC